MQNDCLIIGSGMSGLAAANILKEKGLKITVLDKGRGTGGRIATRRFSNKNSEEGVFDYGAQYFTVRDPRFEKVVYGWLENGIAMKWSEGFYTKEGHLKNDGIQRYAGVDNMRQITKYMAQNINVFQSAKVVGFSWKNNYWEVYTENKQVFTSRVILLTPPVPQSLDLFASSGLVFTHDFKQKLEAVEYDPCIAIMAICDGPTNLKSPGGIWGDGKNIAWLCDNSLKGLKTDAFSITVHTTPDFSNEFWDYSGEEIFRILKEDIRTLTGVELTEYQVHKWRYSLPVTRYESSYAFLDTPGPVFFAGDAFCGGRVEGAFISGIEAADKIVQLYQR